MNNELIVKINPTEIFQTQNEGKDFIVNPNAEKAIIRLLEIQAEVDKAVELLKSEIERQALEFNPNISAIKGEKIKINYSAAGAKYKDNGEAKFHSSGRKRPRGQLIQKRLMNIERNIIDYLPVLQK